MSVERQYKDATYGQFARIGKAVSHPKRLEILDVLCQSPRTVGSLAETRLAEVEQITRRFLDGREGMEPVETRELLKRVREGRVTVLDVRPVEEYNAGHIAGAVSIPLKELQRRLAEVPKGRPIVAYCRGPYCVLAVHAVEILRKHGFAAARLADGVPEGGAHGLAVEGDARGSQRPH